jgi:tetratricopeptide (TPR) repeat protein
MIKKVIIEYLKTIIRTILLALISIIVILILIQYQLDVQQSNLMKQENSIKVDHSLIGVQISKYQYLEGQDPDNYNINFKLGTLFEMEKDYKSAEVEYKLAIGKISFGEYKPHYKLACLYISENRLDEAQQLIDNIGEYPDKKLINYKADIYNQLGDKYYDLGDYEEAASRYRKSMFYYQIIKSRKCNRLKGDLASSYLYLADEKVNQMQIDAAINYLQMAKALINAPIIEYKLAVLITDQNPDLAYQYFDDVFKAAPEIINYEDYSRLLAKLEENAIYEGDTGKVALYQYKIKKLKDFANTNILYVDDLTLDNAKGKFSLNRWQTKYKIHFECLFNNHSKNNIDSLFVQIVFKTNQRVVYLYSQQIFDKNSIIQAQSKSPIVNITAYAKKLSDEKIPDNMTVQVYVSKIQNSYKILLSETKINLTQPERRKIKLFGLTFYLPLFLS